MFFVYFNVLYFFSFFVNFFRGEGLVVIFLWFFFNLMSVSFFWLGLMGVSMGLINVVFCGGMVYADVVVESLEVGFNVGYLILIF